MHVSAKLMTRNRMSHKGSAMSKEPAKPQIVSTGFCEDVKNAQLRFERQVQVSLSLVRLAQDRNAVIGCGR